MEGQVVGAGETAFAVDALERLGACVFAVVTGQFVRAGESPLTALPRALVRFLTCKLNGTRTSVNAMVAPDTLLYTTFILK